MAPNPKVLEPIFVVGCPRSGTTMLRDALRSHPGITFPNESHFIPSLYRGYGDPRNSREAVKLASRIMRLRWVREWGLPLEPSAFSELRTFHDVIALFYSEYARKENKPRWGDKTPQYVTEIPTLKQIFPGAKFIHIIRDGRDVALSWIHAGFGPGNIYKAAKMWRESVAAGIEHGRALGADQYLEIRYEDLTRDPHSVLHSVCAFMGEPFDESMLNLNRIGEGKYSATFTGKRSPVGEGRTIVSNSGKWRQAMSKAESSLFESLAGDLLAELGYETDGESRRIGFAEKLKWQVHHEAFWWWQRIENQGRTYLAESAWILTEARLRAALRDGSPSGASSGRMMLSD